MTSWVPLWYSCISPMAVRMATAVGLPSLATAPGLVVRSLCEECDGLVEPELCFPQDIDQVACQGCELALVEARGSCRPMLACARAERRWKGSGRHGPQRWRGGPCATQRVHPLRRTDAGVGWAGKKRKAVGCVRSFTSGWRSGNARCIAARSGWRSGLPRFLRAMCRGIKR